MKVAKAWCWAVLVLAAGVASTSCAGKDEGTKGGAGGKTATPGVAGGGSGGQIGRGETGGSSGSSSGTGGVSPAITVTKLGKGCEKTTDCEDRNAPDLICIPATETALGDGAPPKGLCTKSCATTQDCRDVSEGSICFTFSSEAKEGYCIEGCDQGAPDVGVQKCHNRPEFACNPFRTVDTMVPCASADDCEDGELCGSNGVCEVALSACLPACRGDLDCAAGMFCDQSFLSGVCVKDKPAGKGFGQPCTVPGDDEPDEPDGCIGFCQHDDDTTNKGHCQVTCGLFRECGWNPSSNQFDGACYYGSAFTTMRPGEGDFGYCAPACDCSGECRSGRICELLPAGPLDAKDFSGAGLCFAPGASSVEYSQCEVDGTAGAPSDSGAGGAAGAGG